MKLATFVYQGQERVGQVDVAAGQVLPLAEFSAMQQLIESGRELTALTWGPPLPLAAVTLAAPLPQPRQDVICLGVNYLDHAQEAAHFVGKAFQGPRQYPIYFGKRVNRALADGETLPWPGQWDEGLDYEAELAVIIGQAARDISPEQARQHIFGYTILNDISARTLQSRHSQWYRGKSLDGFCPLGPWIVTADQLGLGQGLAIRSYVNGELRQDSNTDRLIFDVAYVVSELSQGLTLLPGTIISTGTPSGVGIGFDPPRYLRPGDQVRCQIDHIGSLTTVIGAAEARG